MLSGTIVGPYARTVTAEKLKFWFALVGHEPDPVRYEVTVDRIQRTAAYRRRPLFGDKPGTHRANFNAYRIPDDLSAYRALAFPRFKGDRFPAAALSMLEGEDVADVTRVRLIGLLPNPKETSCCTSSHP